MTTTPATPGPGPAHTPTPAHTPHPDSAHTPDPAHTPAVPALGHVPAQAAAHTSGSVPAGTPAGGVVGHPLDAAWQGGPDGSAGSDGPAGEGGVPSPDGVLRLINGYWATGVLAAAATHRLFTHLAAGAGEAAGLARAAGISERGAQAMLDALVALGLVELRGSVYVNGPQAATYLVEDSAVSLAGFARLKLKHMGALADLPQVVQAGGPVSDAVVEVADNPHWRELVLAIAPQSVPAARVAAGVLGLAGAGPVEILDVGGGSGVYAATWLQANAAARVTQLDWAPINAIARSLMDQRGLAQRFTTIDGDFHTTDFGTGVYDVALYSHIAHQEGPGSNIEVFTRLRQALRDGGALVVCDYVVDDDRSGPAFPLVFACEMLLKSHHGSTWRQAEYRDWLAKAGFTDITFHRAPPATLIVAR